MGSLKVTSGPLAGRAFTLDRELVLGRKGADIEIDDHQVSRRHAAVRPIDGGVEIEDLDSTNGTFVDGQRIERPTRLTADGEIQIGSSVIWLELDRPTGEQPPSEAEASGLPSTLLRIVGGTAPGTMIPVGTEPFVIGRGERGLGMLDGDPELSRQHAKVSRVDGRVVVEDLASTNGTWVNGNRIAAPTVLRPGDSLYVGTTSLKLIELGPGESSGLARLSASTIGRVRAAETDMLDKLAGLCYRRPKQMLAATALLFVCAVFFGAPVVGKLASHPQPDPAAESTLATEAIEDASGNQLSPNIIALVRTEGGIDTDATRQRVEEVVSTLEEEPLVSQVADFYSSNDDALVSRDEEFTSVAAVMEDAEIADVDEAGDELAEKLRRQEGVLVGGPGRVGPTIGETVGEDIGKAERLAFPLLLLASIFIFRGFVAALLPLYVGILTVFATFLSLRFVNAAFADISVFALNMVIALGLGLAIDYSLFIVSRYREELQRGESGLEPIRRTLKTAGRTVIFSALTVAAAMGVLVVFPQAFVYSMGIGGALCSLLAMVIALTALPALLVALGPRVNAGSPKRWRRSMERTAAQERSGFWFRLSQTVMKAPIPFALASAGLMLLLGSAFLRIDFVGRDVTALPRDVEVRQVDEILLNQFDTNRGRQINIAVEATPQEAEEVRQYADELRPFPNVADVTPPQQLSQALWQINLFPEHRELDPRTQDLVEEIREQPAPFPTQVAGQTAEYLDEQESLKDHIPIALALLTAVTLLVLFALTGSVILPIKTLLMNALTISAAFGVLVLIFQDGRLEGLLGYESQGGIEQSIPLLLFALSFGLSTDYAVFLLTRIKEARDSGHGERESVAIGLERTGRIVTAAALLFCIAIGAFATSKIIFIKEIGVGTAFAVAIDATIVRALLVPSLMALLGSRNWWAPGPLRRLHKKVGISET